MDYTITLTANDGGRNLSRMGFQISVESASGPEGNLVAQGSDIKTVALESTVHHVLNEYRIVKNQIRCATAGECQQRRGKKYQQM